MNKKIISWVVVAVFIVGGIFFFRNETVAPTETDLLPAVTENSDTVSDATVKEFTITGTSFALAPSTMTVNVGDRVRVTFKNSGGMHDFKIDEFDASTKVLKSGEEETIEFVADRAGTFEYYCSLGTHRQMGMRGNLVVTE